MSVPIRRHTKAAEPAADQAAEQIDRWNDQERSRFDKRGDCNREDDWEL